MQAKKGIYTVIALGCLIAAGCTNPTTTAGSTSTVYDGTITGVELVDMDTGNQDSSTNGMLGLVAGAVAGNLINGHTGGTLAGAGLGMLAGSGLSMVANRKDGARLSVDTDAGPMIVDMPFSCSYKIGTKVRLASSGSKAFVMVKNGEHYITPKEDSPDKCPTNYTKQ